MALLIIKLTSPRVSRSKTENEAFFSHFAHFFLIPDYIPSRAGFLGNASFWKMLNFFFSKICPRGLVYLLYFEASAALSNHQNKFFSMVQCQFSRPFLKIKAHFPETLMCRVLQYSTWYYYNLLLKQNA